jgi:hypothetical protein
MIGSAYHNVLDALQKQNKIACAARRENERRAKPRPPDRMAAAAEPDGAAACACVIRLRCIDRPAPVKVLAASAAVPHTKP